MPRKSVAEKMMGERGDRSLLHQYPAPPAELTEEGAKEWRAIVFTMAAGYFARSHYPMLIQLCRHIEASNRIAGFIEMAKADELGKLLALQARESASIIKLCRQMRLSHQAVVHSTNKNDTTPKRELPAPWEIDAEDADLGDHDHEPGESQ